MTDHRDLTQDNGRAPPFAKPEPMRSSGSPREEIDPATPDVEGESDTEDEADSNGQQNVEDRPNVSTVTPDDYPQQQ